VTNINICTWETILWPYKVLRSHSCLEKYQTRRNPTVLFKIFIGSYMNKLIVILKKKKTYSEKLKRFKVSWIIQVFKKNKEK